MAVPTGEQDESLCQSFLSRLKELSLQLQRCESSTIHHLRLPLDKDLQAECARRITEQQVTCIWHLESA